MEMAVWSPEEAASLLGVAGDPEGPRPHLGQPAEAAHLARLTRRLRRIFPEGASPDDWVSEFAARALPLPPELDVVLSVRHYHPPETRRRSPPG